MAALETSIRSGAPFTKARSPHDCAFGKWYDSYHPKDRRLALMLTQFASPHAEIHGLADTLLGMAEGGQTDGALGQFAASKETTLALLMKLFDSVQQLVQELQRRVAIVMDDGEETCALGADSVRDIVTIPAGKIRQGDKDAEATAALVILEDGSIVPLLNWRYF